MSDTDSTPREIGSTLVCPVCGKDGDVKDTRDDGSVTMAGHRHNKEADAADKAAEAEAADSAKVAEVASADSLPRETGTVVKGDV